jgi:peroxiredoxin Q/BCP
VIIGISTDKLDTQEQFTKKENLNFALMADADKTAAMAYGVLLPAGYAKRVTFVIDKKGVVRKIYEVSNIDKHMDEVLAYVKENLAVKK